MDGLDIFNVYVMGSIEMKQNWMGDFSNVIEVI